MARRGGSAIDISLLGEKALQQKLKKLPGVVQRKVVTRAMRNEAKRVKARVVHNLSGVKVGVVTGQTLAAFKRAKVRSGAHKRGTIRLGMVMPTREELRIPPGAKHFYVGAVEYGHKGAPPHPFIRPAVDEHKEQSRRALAAEIGRGIVREAKKL